MSLTGQHVAVLGGTSGIGLAVAAAAAEQDAKVTVVSSRQTSVDRAKAELPSGVTGRVTNLADAGQVRDLFDTLGPLDHLVYTAGDPLLLTPLADLDIDTARKFFELRYFGALTAVQAAAPHLAPTGSITLTSGTAGIRPGPGFVVAASVCTAMEGLTRALAVELAPIRVNAVMPGVVRTPLWDPMPQDMRDQLYRDNAAATPLRRVAGPDDIARGYLYFLSQPHATGTVITLDGGAVLV
ncbi:SDR family oxidoreductase [Nocardia alni]|uniref:SDR family oxidoreductase n=1 Tax=Nocardia alni TaxID=2815723 RepID=UPI001C228886|nr:SDR family oxidoreductase [Nocardia alni]